MITTYEVRRHYETASPQSAYHDLLMEAREDFASTPLPANDTIVLYRVEAENLAAVLAGKTSHTEIDRRYYKNPNKSQILALSDTDPLTQAPIIAIKRDRERDRESLGRVMKNEDESLSFLSNKPLILTIKDLEGIASCLKTLTGHVTST